MPRGKPVSKFPSLYTKSKKVKKHLRRRNYKPQIKSPEPILMVTEQIANARLLLANARTNIGVAVNIIDEAMRSVGLKWDHSDT